MIPVDAYDEAGELPNRVRELWREDKAEEALLLCQDVVTRHRQDIGVQEFLAFALWERGHKEDALTAMRRSVELGNDLECPLLIFGRWLSEMGHLDEFETLFRKLAKKYPEKWFWLTELGWELMEAGQFDRGSAAYRDALFAHATKVSIVSRFVCQLSCADRWDEALEALDTYGPKAMSASEYRNQRGTMFAERGMRPEAEREWRLSLTADGHTANEIDAKIADWGEFWFEGGREREEAEFP